LKLNLKTTLLAAALAAAGAMPVHAQNIIIDLADWQTDGGFGDPGNTNVFFTLPAGTIVTGFSYSGLTFTSLGASWQSELVLSVNNTTGGVTTIDEFLDWAPSLVNDPGLFGPVSGVWQGSTGVEGPFGAGAAFTLGGGPDNLWVTVYEDLPDAGIDAIISAGTLTIFITPIPEPATYGLMALGLMGVAVAARRRKAD